MEGLVEFKHWPTAYLKLIPVNLTLKAKICLLLHQKKPIE